MAINVPAAALETAKAAAAKLDADVFLYNGEIAALRDLEFIEIVSDNFSRKEVIVVLTTNGGDPDAAYRICRYLQHKYEKVTVLIAGRCKSAGTLIAVGSSELAFMPYGELGPLDIQLSKVDKFDRVESGLVIQDALNTLEDRAKQSFYTIVNEYIAANNGLLSFPTASKAASDFVTQLYAPVFGRIDPEEVGARSRSMRIAVDYGKRLAAKWSNVKHGAIQKLAETYSSHSFVIDQREAAGLFEKVRGASAEEVVIVEALGNFARFQLPGDEHAFHALSTKFIPEEDTHANDDEDGGKSQDGGDPSGASGETDATPSSEGSGGTKPGLSIAAG
ncbi:SDH family Clp fold serine proteinase [Sphingomonas sp. Leaf17]|uniref:SDH family Clp fold serine proteinase n=1 Tax=Sphingomonas sp. Leaf17 TaxID=1735683 RepID=UPI0009EB13F7|nr:hypothetical protein [Sphingomonas sp. Leaf17]